MSELATWIATALGAGGIIAAGAVYILRESFKSLLRRSEEEARAETQLQLEAIRGEQARGLESLRASYSVELEVLKSLLSTDQEVRKLAAKESMAVILRLMQTAMVLERKTFHGSDKPGARWPQPTPDELNNFLDEVRQSRWLMPRDVSDSFDLYLARLGGASLAKDMGPKMMEVWKAATDAYDNLTNLVRQFVWVSRPSQPMGAGGSAETSRVSSPI